MASAFGKFLFVINNLGTGGAQRQMVNLATGLQQRGHQVAFFCYAAGDLLAGPLHAAGIPIHWYFKRSRFSTDVILALKRVLEREKYDLALSFLTTPNFYTLLARRILSLGRVPVIVSERRIDLPGGASRLEKIVRQTYRLATHVTANSYCQQDVLERQYPWLKGKLSVIYNGYDLEHYAPAAYEPVNQPVKILVVASVVARKNGLCLVEALHMLRQQYGLTPHVDWIGKHSDMPDYVEQMNQQIRSYGLELQWHWLGERADMVEQYQAHDVLVLPSRIEGLPNVVCEALACARPVILTQAVDHPRLVQDGQSGYLFDGQDPQDLAEKLRTFCSLSLAERQAMGQKGRQYAEKHLSMGGFLDAYEQLFLEFLQKPSKNLTNLTEK